MIRFTPGPSQLYFTVYQHIRRALQEGIPSLPHRSNAFTHIVEHTTAVLRQLLNLPSDAHLFFTSSATEVFERSLQNLVHNKSFHFVNGAFSRRYYEFSHLLKKNSEKIDIPPGTAFASIPPISDEVELLTLTHTETSTGVSLPFSFLESLRKAYPNVLIAIDGVSSVPYYHLDFSHADTFFFSVQKAFGLPAGLGVWIVNDTCLAKAELLSKKGVNVGTYHSLPTYYKYALLYQTPETPNMLGIYVLGKVAEDFLRRGLSAIRKETEYKAAILYAALAQNDHISPFVSNKEWQSQTVIVAHCCEHTPNIAAFLRTQGLEAGLGHGDFKNDHLRFGNFPTHSKEDFEKLADLLLDWDPSL